MLTSHAIAREQLRLFDRIGDRAALSEDERRRVLLLSEQEWSAWLCLLHGGEVPRQPTLPVMLRRLGAASYRLAVIAERRRVMSRKVTLGGFL